MTLILFLQAAWIPIGRCGVCTREKRTPTQAGAAGGKKGVNKGVNKVAGPAAKVKTVNVLLHKLSLCNLNLFWIKDVNFT